MASAGGHAICIGESFRALQPAPPTARLFMRSWIDKAIEAILPPVTALLALLALALLWSGNAFA